MTETQDIRDAYLIEDSEQNCAVFEALGGVAYRVTSGVTALQYLERIREMV